LPVKLCPEPEHHQLVQERWPRNHQQYPFDQLVPTGGILRQRFPLGEREQVVRPGCRTQRKHNRLLSSISRGSVLEPVYEVAGTADLVTHPSMMTGTSSARLSRCRRRVTDAG